MIRLIQWTVAGCYILVPVSTGWPPILSTYTAQQRWFRPRVVAMAVMMAYVNNIADICITDGLCRFEYPSATPTSDDPCDNNRANFYRSSMGLPHNWRPSRVNTVLKMGIYQSVRVRGWLRSGDSNEQRTYVLWSINIWAIPTKRPNSNRW